MLYFSGFCLQNESELFDSWLIKSDFSVAGFSYGAIKAVEYILENKKRVDRLQLFSPAFFNNKDDKFKKMQLLYFAKDKDSYTKNFLKNISDGSDIDMSRYLKVGTKDELNELLYYNWSRKKLETIANRGVEIEIFLGESDKIIDSKSALEFFANIGTTYFIKDANHILR